LPARARALITDTENEIFVSAASVWEIAIKHALARGGPDDMPVSGAEALQYFQESGYELVDISAADAAAVETLPLPHADPFDRLLLAQVPTKSLRLVTHDARVMRHNASTIEV
jgi:PIN domain nuclease of toxin-antitoxin system